jgi:hypothetical protein
MAKIEVNGVLKLDVDENFFKLSPKDQQEFVDQAVIQDAITGTGRAFMSGMMFSFRDEVVAALSEPASFVGGFMDEEGGEEYRRELTRQRLLESGFRQQYPITSTLAELGGGVLAPGAALGVAARGATLGAKLGRTMAAGAGLGALSGAGAGEDLESRAVQAGAGGALGAAVAPVAAAAFPVVGAIAAPAVTTVRRFAEAGVVEPSVRAARMVARRLKEAGVTSDALEALKREPKPMALADISSKGVQSLARLVAQSPGKGAELAESLNVRQFGDDAIDGAAKRIEQDLVQAGIPRQTALEAQAGINIIKGAKSSELYDKSNAFKVTNELRAKLKPLFSRPSMKGIIAEARNLAKERGENFRGSVLANIDMRGLDYVQRILRRKQRSLFNPASQASDPVMGGAVKSTRDEIVKILDEANPDFKTARSVYADAEARREALELGRKFKTMRSEGEIEDAIKDFGEDELHNFRVGMAQTIRDDIARARDGADFASRIAGNKQQITQMKEAFPPEAMAPIEEALSKESQMAATRGRTMSGSQSFQTFAEGGRAAQEDLGMMRRTIEGFRQGGPTGAVAAGVGPMAESAIKAIGPRTNRELGRLLFATDPAERAAAITRVQQARGMGRPSAAAPILPQQQPPMPGLMSRALRETPGTIGRGLLFSAADMIGEELSPVSPAQAGMLPGAGEARIPEPGIRYETRRDRFGRPITYAITGGGTGMTRVTP